MENELPHAVWLVCFNKVQLVEPRRNNSLAFQSGLLHGVILSLRDFVCGLGTASSVCLLEEAELAEWNSAHDTNRWRTGGIEL